MKKIEAYLKPFRLPDVRVALADARFDVIRVKEAEECRPTEAYTEIVQGQEYEVDVMPRVQLVLVVENHRVDRAVEILQRTGATDHDFDGLILVSPIERVISVDPREAPESGPAACPPGRLA
ncbi:MAG: P-II family nitrogen regulator [Planctomycetes bacterium]|nr:P-II family nitrogen regulator [Planctomycetota bacterium]